MIIQTSIINTKNAQLHGLILNTDAENIFADNVWILEKSLMVNKTAIFQMNYSEIGQQMSEKIIIKWTKLVTGKNDAKSVLLLTEFF